MESQDTHEDSQTRKGPGGSLGGVQGPAGKRGKTHPLVTIIRHQVHQHQNTMLPLSLLSSSVPQPWHFISGKAREGTSRKPKTNRGWSVSAPTPEERGNREVFGN